MVHAVPPDAQLPQPPRLQRLQQEEGVLQRVAVTWCTRCHPTPSYPSHPDYKGYSKKRLCPEWNELEAQRDEGPNQRSETYILIFRVLNSRCKRHGDSLSSVLQ